MRASALAVIFAALPVVGALVQIPPATGPSVTVLPSSGGSGTVYQAHVQGLPARIARAILLINSTGHQTVVRGQADAGGSIDLTLQPPVGGWQLGLYRLAVPLPGGESVSSTFAVGDGAPHLLVQPYLPSPTSAFNFVGVGLPAGTHVDLLLVLTGNQGQYELQATTDNAGSFSMYFWPQEAGLPFFEAGLYRIIAPAFQLSTDFTAEEHPGSSSISIDRPVVAGAVAMLHFRNYLPQRYIWGVWAAANGRVVGELLVGPTDSLGSADAAITVPAVPGGSYLLATPYDWGETAVTVTEPPATSTPVPEPGRERSGGHHTSHARHRHRLRSGKGIRPRGDDLQRIGAQP